MPKTFFLLLFIMACQPDSTMFPPSMPSGAARRLQHATRFDMLTIQPHLPAEGEAPATEVGGYEVIERNTVPGEGVQRDLLVALGEGMRHPVSPAACFNPRFGLEVLAEGHTVDVLISFECQKMRLYEDGVFVGVFPLSEVHARPVIEIMFLGLGMPIAE